MSTGKRKLLILIPDGTGIKNYLLSSFITKAVQEFDVILAHNFDDEIEKEIAVSADQYLRVRIPEYNEPFLLKFYREAITYARLLYNSRIRKNPTILINWRRSFKQITKKTFYQLVKTYGKYLANDYKRIQNTNQLYHDKVMNSHSIKEYVKLIQDYQPDVVVTTHQRSVLNVPLFAAAKKLNKTSVSFIYSWDNMPKARIPYFSDYFYVWSDYMKSEFDDYYPEIDDDRIKITGTPQFEFYLDETLLKTKADFCLQYNLDENRPIVCFSGDDRLTSPFDPFYLRDMAQVFSEVDKKNRPQIMLRPSPADDGSRFQWVLEEYSNIIYAPADWFESNSSKHWSVKFPKKNDIKNLVNVTYHADAVVNVGSTMAHDFAMFKKPAFYLNYMPEVEISTLEHINAKNWSIKTIYKYEHFRSMDGLKPVYWINARNDFKNIPLKIVKYDEKEQADQKKWRDKIIGEMLYKQASTNLVNELSKLN